MPSDTGLQCGRGVHGDAPGPVPTRGDRVRHRPVARSRMPSRLDDQIGAQRGSRTSPSLRSPAATADVDRPQRAGTGCGLAGQPDCCDCECFSFEHAGDGLSRLRATQLARHRPASDAFRASQPTASQPRIRQTPRKGRSAFLGHDGSLVAGTDRGGHRAADAPDLSAPEPSPSHVPR